ncbi:MAG: TonB-dependent receptor domain-containing protein, partial [Phenylobacterium sp.]
MSAGGEYRREHGNVTHNLANQPWYNDYTLSYGLDYGGTTQVLEGYLELKVPVLKDMALFHYLELDGAIRETSNKNTETAGPSVGASTTKNFATWKLSGTWDLTDWLTLHGTRSRDVRAAQFRELYQSFAVTAGGPFGSVNNPWNSGISDPAFVTSGGDINLKPERADTWTFGGIISPKSGPLSHLQLSADWYDITIKDAIIGPPFGVGAQNIVAQCFAGVQSFCDRMTGEGTHDILTINNVAVNLQGFTTRGIDLEANYQLPLDEVSGGLNGDMNFRVIASYLYDMLFSTGLGTPTVNYAGQSGPTGAFGSFNTSPKWQANGFITYHTGPFIGTVQLRYIGPGKFETITGTGGLAVGPGDPGYATSNPNSINNNHVDSRLYVNLSASYDVTEHFGVFGAINNLFDKDPPMAPGGNGYPTNPVYFDTYGMTWKLGVRARF